jgi:hypothetical protein
MTGLGSLEREIKALRPARKVRVLFINDTARNGGPGRSLFYILRFLDPAVIVPNGFRDDGTPVSVTFLGGLFDEARLLAVAHAYQEATDFHRRTPPLTP